MCKHVKGSKVNGSSKTISHTQIMFAMMTCLAKERQWFLYTLILMVFDTLCSFLHSTQSWWGGGWIKAL